MTFLTSEAIDHVLAVRSAEVSAMSATLMELDDHPGLQHLRRYPPTGETAARWAVIEPSLARLWDDLGHATTIVDSARAVRGRRPKLPNAERAELTRLLFGRPLEVARRAIPLGQRRITDPAEVVEYIGLADIVGRMNEAYPAVAGFLDAVDAIDTLIARRLASSQNRLGDAGLADVPEIGELLRASAVDPLGLTPAAVDGHVAAIEGSIERRIAEAAELVALQTNWTAALDATAARLDVLRDAGQGLLRLRARVAQTVVCGPLPMRLPAEPDLRAELATIAAAPVGRPDPAALLSLRHRIEAALQATAEDERIPQGLLDRLAELTGRLTVYQAKAVRLGLGQDCELLTYGRNAAGLLSRRPCDLRAATRAVNDFQHLVVARHGEPS